jgi:hypothetical protein
VEHHRIGTEQAIGQLPQSLQNLATFERFNLYKPARFQNIARDPAFDRRYLPQNCGAFALPCFWVLRKHLYVYGCHPECLNTLSPWVGRNYNDRLLFPIHPLSLPHYKEFLSAVGARLADEDTVNILAVPTSSVRTLLAWPSHSPERALFVKTTLLPSPMFGDRRLTAAKIAYCTGVNKLLEESAPSLPRAIGFLPESAAFVPRKMLDMGVIIRSIPQEISDGRALIVPLFSLVGSSENHMPLLPKVIARSGTQAIAFIDDVYCSQFAKLWVELTMHCGLILEAHGQNLMLALSPDYSALGRFFYRDFDGLMVDWRLREARGLPQPLNMPYAWSWHQAYGSTGVGTPHVGLVWWKLWMSLYAYLHYVLDPLNRCLQEWRAMGLIGGQRIDDDELTMRFSHHLVGAIENMFGVPCRYKANIYRSLKQFLIVLLTLRRDLIGRKP